MALLSVTGPVGLHSAASPPTGTGTVMCPKCDIKQDAQMEHFLCKKATVKLV